MLKGNIVIDWLPTSVFPTQVTGQQKTAWSLRIKYLNVFACRFQCRFFVIHLGEDLVSGQSCNFFAFVQGALRPFRGCESITEVFDLKADTMPQGFWCPKNHLPNKKAIIYF